MTEKVTPLEEHRGTPDGQSQFSTAWGLHQILVREREREKVYEILPSLSSQKGLAFLSNDCGLVHHNVSVSSVFVDEAGEWKLGGVEFMTSFADSAAAGPAGKILPALRRYDPPETSKPAAARKTEKWCGELPRVTLCLVSLWVCRSADMWGLGCLLWELFNGSLSQVSSLKNTSKVSTHSFSFIISIYFHSPSSSSSSSSAVASCQSLWCLTTWSV